MSLWTTDVEDVRRAAMQPDIAEVLVQCDAAMVAVTTGDVALFSSLQAPELHVNSPANRVFTGEQATQAMAMGAIGYDRFDRKIDYLGTIPGGLVVVMGEETMVPRGKAMHAGQTVTRRYTDLWRKVDGSWRLSARQATIVAVE